MEYIKHGKKNLNLIGGGERGRGSEGGGGELKILRLLVNMWDDMGTEESGGR